MAGALVTAASPSQTVTVTTDASGRFSMLSLAPDTYTISAAKQGFETASITGVSVFADQVQTIRVTLAPSLKTIARVTARSSMDLVKPGTTTDVYSVNSTVTQAAAGVGGGGNLNNAYSAIATVPGVVRSAQPARLGSDGLHPRRQLRSGRLRVRRRAGEPLVRQLSGRHGRNAGPARAAGLRGRRNRRRERDRPGRFHQSGHQDRDLPRIRYR